MGQYELGIMARTDLISGGWAARLSNAAATLNSVAAKLQLVTGTDLSGSFDFVNNRDIRTLWRATLTVGGECGAWEWINAVRAAAGVDAWVYSTERLPNLSMLTEVEQAIGVTTTLNTASAYSAYHYTLDPDPSGYTGYYFGNQAGVTNKQRLRHTSYWGVSDSYFWYAQDPPADPRRWVYNLDDARAQTETSTAYDFYRIADFEEVAYNTHWIWVYEKYAPASSPDNPGPLESDNLNAQSEGWSLSYNASTDFPNDYVPSDSSTNWDSAEYPTVSIAGPIQIDYTETAQQFYSALSGASALFSVNVSPVGGYALVDLTSVLESQTLTGDEIGFASTDVGWNPSAWKYSLSPPPVWTPSDAWLADDFDPHFPTGCSCDEAQGLGRAMSTEGGLINQLLWRPGKQ